jgi:hypothetical protein
MEKLQDFLNSILPPASEEDMVVAISILIKEANEDSRQTAIEDPLHQQMKEVYLKLQSDAYEHGLIAELSDFILENPGIDMITLDSWFRNEWDL